MNYREFVNSLKEIKHVYLLAGAESYYIDRGINDLLNKILPNVSERNESLIKIDGDKKTDINEIIAAIETAPFFSDKNVVIVKNSALFKNKASTTDEDNKSKAKDPTMDRLMKALSNMMDTNYVIFTAKESVDKRKKLYKTIAKVGVVLESDPLRAWEIDKWLDYTLRSLNKKMDTGARQYFNELISMLPEISLNYLNNELEKTALYVKGAVITKKDLQTIMAEPPEVSSFALIEAIGEKNLQKSMYLLTAQMNERKEAAIIALLVRQVRLLMRAKYFMRRGLYGRALGEPLGLNPYIAQKTGETSKKFNDKVLEEAFLMLADADYAFKFGKYGAEMLERIIIKLIQN